MGILGTQVFQQDLTFTLEFINRLDSLQQGIQPMEEVSIQKPIITSPVGGRGSVPDIKNHPKNSRVVFDIYT